VKSLITRKTMVIVLLVVTFIASSGIALNWSKVAPMVSGLITSSPQPTPSPVTTTPYRPLVTIHYCKDGEPFYANAIAKQADNAVANAVDGLVTGNSGGVHVFASFIDSSSFGKTALTFNIPAVSAAPVPPAYPNLSDPYKQASALKAYKKELPKWQAAYDAWKKNFAMVQADAHQKTDMLRNLKPAPFDNSGSSIWGCLDTAWLNFQGVSGKKVLVIASDMVQNVTDPLPTGFTLSGVRVEVIFHVCIGSASACAANDAKWKQIFKQYGASKVTFTSVQESQVQPLSF
jgi:hypothetical protein